MDRETFERATRELFSQQPKLSVSLPDPETGATTESSTAGYPPELELLKNAQNGWKFAAEYLILESSCFEAKFFALKMIEDVLKQLCCNFNRPEGASMGVEEHKVLRDILLAYMQKFGDVPEVAKFSPADAMPFVRNKFAQILALALVAFYPNDWPSYFDDLLAVLFHSSLTSGTRLSSSRIDYFLRVCRQIDEELVYKYTYPSEERHQRNTLIKDVMRERDVMKLVDAWYKIIEDHTYLSPEVVSMCMEVIGLYSSWIDVSLIMTERFVSIFYTFFSSSSFRAAACDCVLEILSKKMPPLKKVHLIQSLQILNTFSGLNVDEFEEEFLLPIGRLVNTIGSEICMCWNEFEVEEVEQRDFAYDLINQAYPLLLKFLSSRHDSVSILVLDFSLSFLNILKSQKKKKNSLAPQHHDALKALLSTIVTKMKIKTDDDIDYEDDQDESCEFTEFRRSLKIQLDNIAIIDETIVMDSMFPIIMSILENLNQSTFNDVELALKLMHTLGEVLKSNEIGFMKPDTDFDGSNQAKFTTMMHAIMRVGISSFPNPIVQIRYFENVTRYFKFFENFPSLLGEVLSSFLDTRGFRNPDTHVRSRVAYLFNRFVKATKPCLEPYIDQLLSGLRQFTDPISPGIAIGNNETYFDDQLLIYETVGLLVSLYHSNKQRQIEELEIFLTPIYLAATEILQKRLYMMENEGSQTYITYLYHFIMSLGSICMGSITGGMDSQCLTMFQRSLELTLLMLKTIPNSEELRKAARFAFQRYATCLGSDMLRLLPDIVSQLIGDCTMKNLIDFIPLLNQLVFRFKDIISPGFDEILQGILERYFFYLNQPTLPTDIQGGEFIQTDDVITTGELRKAYVGFIQTIFNSNLGLILSSEKNLPLLPNVLQSIFVGAVDSKDLFLQKLSFVILTKMVELWAGSTTSAIPNSHLTQHVPLAGFDRFVYEQIVPLCLRQLRQLRSDPNDALASMVIGEIGLLLKVSYLRIGMDFLSYLRQVSLPSVGFSTSMTEKLCSLLEADNFKIFKSEFKSFLKAIQPT